MPSLTFYGGANEIGGNKILLEDGDTRLFFDFGTSFARRYRYFEEYLKPRPITGLLDPLEMGLLPPLRGIYRPDMEPTSDLWPRFSSSPLYRELSIDGVLLSHAHLDHSGYISFLRDDIPIYATAMTATIAKAIQDSGKGDFEKEVCYAIPKEETDGILQAAHWQKVSARQRPFHVLDLPPPTSQALAFWEATPGARGLQVCPWEEVCRIGSLHLKHFPVDHSIFGAAAFAVETSSGWVIYTGDLRRHGWKGHLVEEFATAASHLKPVALICEGTNIAGSRAASEEEVYTGALKAVAGAKALVIADFGPRNVERLLTFRQVAEQTNRRLVISARDAYLLRAMRYVSQEVPDPASDEVIAIYENAKAQLDRWEKGIRSDYKAKLASAEEIHRRQPDYIVCFSFFDINELPSIMPQAGSSYIYSSSEVFNEEGALDMKRLHNWLDHFGIAGVGLPIEVEPGRWEVPEEETGLHASGHATGPELLDLITGIKPKILVPIHTENPGYFERNLKGTGIEVRPPEYGGKTVFP